MEVHLDLILLATSLWISGLFSLFLGKTWAKRFRRVFHLETCSCLRVTSLLARGLHGCTGALLSICHTEVLNKNGQMNQRQLFVRKVAPRRGLQFLKKLRPKHLCCRTDNGEICGTIIFMRSTSVQHAVDACVVCIRLHGGPGLTVRLVFS